MHNCLFNGTDTGLRMKSTRGRGGVIENIYIDQINMVAISGDAFTFDLYYANTSSTHRLRHREANLATG